VETAIRSVRMLLVSRDSSTLRCLSNVGELNSWHLETAHSGLEALERLQATSSPDLVLLDLVTDDPDSLHTLPWLQRVCPRVPVILLAQSDDHQRMVEALRLGARDFLIKPCHEQHLEQVLKGHLAGSSQNDVAATVEEIEKISDGLVFVAVSPAMKKLRAQAELLAQVNVPVLILGEKGSGKQTTAQLIHELSLRSGSRLVKVSCSALAGEQLEQEIFGRELGVANRADVPRPGKFEFSHRGTLLLKQISEMPASLQARMVGALQRQQIVKRGSEKVNLDVRILATNTGQVGREECNENGDLMSRLSAFTIHVPSLRQRKEDIPVLLGHFVKKFGRHYGLQSRNLSAHALEACLRYAWPGNVTELENFVKGYLMLGDDSLLMVGDASMRPRNAASTIVPELSRGVDMPDLKPTISVEAAGPIPSSEPASLKTLVRNVKEEAERSAIAGALDRTRWNRKAAARLLKISYRALLYKIHEYQMSPPESYFTNLAAPSPLKDSRS
jgi:two-component system response regulator AtoC